MIAANRALFAALEDHCERRGEPLSSAGKPRFLQTSSAEKSVLKELRVVDCLRVSGHRSIMLLTYQGVHSLATVGFDFEPVLPRTMPINNSAGYLTCVLLDSRTRPFASPATIKDIVEVGSMEDDDYPGHQWQLIERLFPPIFIVQAEDSLDVDSISRAYLQVCAEECRRTGSWIERDLSDALVALAKLDMPFMPFRAICRAAFDSDPRSMFMALYRCIEATYSRAAATKLVRRLSLHIEWPKIAEALESELGWHPQESSSLATVLAGADEDDLRAVCEILKVDVGQDVRLSASRAIYALRNSIVHFRPGTAEIDVEAVNWNALCSNVVRIVIDVFTQAYATL